VDKSRSSLQRQHPHGNETRIRPPLRPRYLLLSNSIMSVYLFGWREFQRDGVESRQRRREGCADAGDKNGRLVGLWRKYAFAFQKKYNWANFFAFEIWLILAIVSSQSSWSFTNCWLDLCFLFG
jgi:hypothetical protein